MVIYLPNRSVGVRGMLHHIVSALGQVPSFYTATLVLQAADALAAEHAERGRMLTNHDMGSGAVRRAADRAPRPASTTTPWRARRLDQRIFVHYAIAGIDAAEIADYLVHHLKIVERTDTLFSADAITLIHNASRGYPDAINNLAVNALTAAFARNSAIVDEEAARTAISETGD